MYSLKLNLFHPHTFVSAFQSFTFIPLSIYHNKVKIIHLPVHDSVHYVWMVLFRKFLSTKTLKSF